MHSVRKFPYGETHPDRVFLTQYFSAIPGVISRLVDLDIQVVKGVNFRIQGEVVHIQIWRIGIDSSAHLPRFVELNLGDEAQTHRELRALILPG